ncbi:MAG: PAS domain S-box protein [Desulfobacteraceae bacterium]|nr:PAS domain S-box protein [Desulfobacteraceae bacterium]
MGKKLYSSLGLILFFLIFFSCQNIRSDTNTPKVKKGVIDLRNHTFDNNAVKLNGQWEFYWKQWINPEELKTIDKDHRQHAYINVPSSWNNSQIEDQSIKGKGFATYAIHVLLPDGIESWSIHIKEICSAYTLFINGKKKINVGIPAKEESSAIPKIATDVVDFFPKDNTLSLVFHASNYRYSKGGIWDTISIGPKKIIHKNRLNRIAVSFFFLGAIFLMGFYHLSLFIIQKRELTYLFFALFCFLMSFRIILIEERLIMNYFPGLSMNYLFKFEYLTFYLGLSSFLAYFFYLFPKDFNKQLYKVLQVTIFCFSSIVILLPVFYFSQTLKSFQILTFLCILYSVFVIVRALKNKRFGIKIFLFGLLILFITVINDILMVMEKIETVYLFHFGSFVFIICQADILIKKYSSAFQTIEKQERDLNKKNKDLINELENRKKTEYALKQSKEKYRDLVENLNEAIYSVNSNGRIVYVSPQIEQILGYTSEEMIGTSFFDFIHPDDSSIVAKIFENLKLNHLYPGEYRIRSKTGGFRWIRTFSRFTRTGDSESIQGVLIDITENKQNEEALKQSEERFKSIFENANDGILIVDSTLKLVQSNKKMRTLLGYSQNELTALNASDIHPQTDFSTIIHQINKMVKGILPLITNIPVIKKNGDIFFADISSSLIKLENKTYVMGLFRDVSDLKEAQDAKQKLENQLLQSQKMQAIGTLAGGVAHDFNNILSPIIGHSELLLLDLDKNSQSRESIKEIYGSALRAKDLVHQILTFSRQEKGETKLIKIQPILKEVVKMIRATLPTTIDIQVKIDPDCGAMNANPIQMHQLIMNILTNAYHAIGESVGEIRIQLSMTELADSDLVNAKMRPGIYNCLTISDTGMGMDTTIQQRIFEPFFTTKGQGKGTGMGLAVVHGIIENMKGCIKVKSELAKGTEFKSFFPLAKKSFDPIKVKENQTIVGGNEHILFIDDEIDIIHLYQKFLERLGYSVEPYADPLEALENFKTNFKKFDLVITDFAMPKITGDKLAAQIIKLRPDIPIILSTGYSESVSPESAKESGIKEILQKPVIIKELSQKIRGVLDGN